MIFYVRVYYAEDKVDVILRKAQICLHIVIQNICQHKVSKYMLIRI
jgi:hypothetical protein